MNYCDVSKLKGKIVNKIEKFGDSDLVFHCNTGEIFRMYHFQDCCECVYLEDIAGDLNNLINTPILKVEENSSSKEDDWNSMTWTFYILTTVKGYVNLRWYGESNGYYSESVDFMLYENKEEYQREKQFLLKELEERCETLEIFE